MLNRQHTRLLLAPVAALLLGGSAVSAQTYSEEAERIQQAVDVMQALAGKPDSGVPTSIFDRAQAVVVIPSLDRGGLFPGVESGRGVMSVRDPYSHRWSAPAFMSIWGGRFRTQIGLEATDLVLLVMNKDGIDDLLRDEFTLGGTVPVAPGPVDHRAKAASDAPGPAKILVYSRLRGVFEGVTLQGATLRSDQSADDRFYGRRLSTREIVRNQELAFGYFPALANLWQDTLQTLTGGLAAD